MGEKQPCNDKGEARDHRDLASLKWKRRDSMSFIAYHLKLS